MSFDIRAKDLEVTLIFALVWFVLSFVLSKVLTPTILFYSSFALLALFASTLILLIRKVGLMLIFYTLSAIITLSIPNFGGLGIHKLILFISAGLVFELVYDILELSIHNVPIELFSATILAGMTIPIGIWFQVVTQDIGLDKTMLSTLSINITIIVAILSFLGALAAYILWHFIKLSRFVVRYQHEIA